MDRYDWLLFLHVLGAFAMLSSITFFWLVLAATWNADRPSLAAAIGRLTKPAEIVLVVGLLMVVVFGVWLTLDLDGYELWDGWILGGLAMWAIAGETGRRAGQVYAQMKTLPAGDEPYPELRAIVRSRKGLLLHSISTAAVLIALLLMIFKPGAS